MRYGALAAIPVLAVGSCAENGNRDALNACSIVANALHGVALKDSNIKSDVKRGPERTVTFDWRMEERTATFVCTVDTSSREVISFTTDGVQKMDTIPLILREF